MQFRPVARRVAAAGALTLTTLGLSLPPASASEQRAESIEINVKGGSAYFFDRGEAIKVSDGLNEGYGVRAYLHWSSTKRASVYTNKGFGHSAVNDLSIPEGTTVDLTMCYTNNGVDVKCSKSRRGEA